MLRLQTLEAQSSFAYQNRQSLIPNLGEYLDELTQGGEHECNEREEKRRATYGGQSKELFMEPLD